jgi:hypothetical protein
MIYKATRLSRKTHQLFRETHKPLTETDQQTALSHNTIQGDEKQLYKFSSIFAKPYGY